MGGNTGEIQERSERELHCTSTLIIKQGQQKQVLELYFRITVVVSRVQKNKNG